MTGEPTGVSVVGGALWTSLSKSCPDTACDAQCTQIQCLVQIFKCPPIDRCNSNGSPQVSAEPTCDSTRAPKTALTPHISAEWQRQLRSFSCVMDSHAMIAEEFRWAWLVHIRTANLSEGIFPGAPLCYL